MVRSSSHQNAIELSSPSAAGEDARFFAFADTLAAKAFNSNRECEGVGSKAGTAIATAVPLLARLDRPHVPSETQGSKEYCAT